MKKEVSLYLSDERIGSLTIDQVRGRETYMFRYASEYLKSERPMLDPAIRNVAGPQYPLGTGIFGFLADVAPDRWGRKLIKRREKRTLLESDYVRGVCDLTRLGALRIKDDQTGEFVERVRGESTTLRQ